MMKLSCDGQTDDDELAMVNALIEVAVADLFDVDVTVGQSVNDVALL